MESFYVERIELKDIPPPKDSNFLIRKEDNFNKTGVWLFS